MSLGSLVEALRSKEYKEPKAPLKPTQKAIRELAVRIRKNKMKWDLW